MKAPKNWKQIAAIIDVYRYPLLLNLLFTGFAFAWIIAGKFNYTGPYFGAFAIKIVGYAVVLITERLFLHHNRFFLYNLGLGGWRFVLRLITTDLTLWIFITVILWIANAYILTA